MINLYSSRNKVLSKLTFENPVIAALTTNANLPHAARFNKILVLKHVTDVLPEGFLLTLICSKEGFETLGEKDNIVLVDERLNYLSDRDIIKFNPSHSSIQVLYRRNANANSFLVTERCNSFCIMCSQPPRDIDDGYLVNEILQAIPLVDRETKEIGFTGGEPTLLGDRLIELIQSCNRHLPDTALHILSNGRNFQNLSLAKKVAAVQHPDLMWGIPLYSDISQTHDFVVQRSGAFDETIRGILNLKRCQQKVEIRVVIHKHTYKRLPELATFIARNLLFVDHVALMGLEIMGFTKANIKEVWIDPVEYQRELSEAVEILSKYKIHVSVYNHQLCTLTPVARQFSVKSISDWKNEYLPECEGCLLKPECGGFFSSSRENHSKHIRAIDESEAASFREQSY